MPNRKTYYLNALVDLQFGGYPVEKVQRSAAEMSTLFLPYCKDKDSLIIDIDIENSYLRYLEKVGITLPKHIFKNTNVKHSEISNGVAWGWSREAINTLESSGAVCSAPNLDKVKKVNNRQFCNETGKKYAIGVPDSIYCKSIDCFHNAITNLHNKFPLVIKPAFGGSGFGIRVINSHNDIQKNTADLEFYLLHGGAVIEPWCQRMYDLSTNLYLHPDGKIETIRHQRLFSNQFGSFYGIYIAPTDLLLDKWKTKLEDASINATTEISKAGYFGPIGFDSFVYRGNDNCEYLAPIIEINGRHVMSHIAHAVRDQIASAKYCFLRMMSKKRCKLPASYDLLEEQIIKKIDRLILLTPLRVRHSSEWAQPQKNVFFIYADSEEELFDADRKLQLCF